ncbi:aminotransferase class I/II-fold pyridoxal phosphate-dependent enzyme [Sphingobacterium siyangense]|jgi:histidinol-phosphate/aromatic aminotransferase/cobyric acid decarboxylase-like protein/choline kinase|uniref:aminotransferase class I/II-fold pyridoxal phosphate-dependent enzyme n=1 Tax=Sphingobacterium siyangense TaxID=459529 RepID=UPI0028A58CB9|nr:aminotransferase class I/II-fold pyridoxal phosphate-dependent enzyme [Sphingobacterium siyangense]
MQVVILAAGMGKRLQKLTQNHTKCMIVVAEKMIIDRILEEVNHLELTKIIIVTGHGAEFLKEYLNLNYKERKFEFVHNEFFTSTNNIYSLSLTKDYLIQDDTIILESDIVFQEGVLRDLINIPNSNVAVVSKYQPWMEGTVVELDEDSNITHMVSRKYVNIQNISSYYKTVNIYKFSKEFLKNKYIPFLDAYILSYGHNQYYEDVLTILMFIEKTQLKGFVLTDEKWYEIDDQEDLAIANVLFSQTDNALYNYSSCFGGYWRFPNLKDFCYLVNPYFPPVGFLHELNFMSKTLLTYYPSGRKNNDFLAARLFGLNEDYVCLGNGASEIIKIICRILRGKTGIIYPSFEEYHNCFNPNDIIPYDVSNQNFEYSAADIISYYNDKDLENLLLINPDNPSGNYLDKANIKRILDWANHKRIKIIIDESFVDFSSFEDDSLLEDTILEKNRTLIVVKSISKSYGVPGIRLGIIATSNKMLINKVRQEMPIWNINSYAEYFLQIIKRYIDSYRHSCERLAEERERFFSLLNNINYLKVHTSQANYFLCEILTPNYATELSKILLLKYNILVKDCSTKIGIEKKNFIRISVRDKEDNDQLYFALNNI